MAHVLRMPEVLAGATQARLTSWLVTPGTQVTAGQVLAEAETEKAVVELPAEHDGTISRLLVDEGDDVPVGVPIVVLLDRGESEAAATAALAVAGVNSKRIFASPLVRRLAAEDGIRLDDVTGTGPNGRIVRRDLARHIASLQEESATDAAVAIETGPPPALPPARVSVVGPSVVGPSAAEHEDVPLDRMRSAIARRLTESKSTVPHFYVTVECRVDALVELRAQVNARASRKISLNDFVVKAAAGALIDVPVANAIWNGDSIRRFRHADLSVAVATDDGLLAPVVRGVDRMTLTSISETVADLAERARAGRLHQHELEGGSFSVSNLGMYGADQFSAILNPPQSGILAVGAARRAPVVADDGELVVGTVMTVTLSADHRAIDGAVAAQWIAAFRERIQNPLSLLI